MTTRQLSFKGLPQLAIAAGTSAPNPGIAGVQIWSTTANSILVWDGDSWETVGSGGGGSTLTTVEVNLGSTPKCSGKFTISGTALTVGKPVVITKAVGPYTGKGTLADEAEMDLMSISAQVASTTQITAYWHSTSPVRGNVKFNYFIGA